MKTLRKLLKKIEAANEEQFGKQKKLNCCELSKHKRDTNENHKSSFKNL